MNRTLKTLLAVVVAVCTTLTINAQDLSSQRGESQDLGSLLGHRLDHAGLVINPTPQSLNLLRSLPADISQGVVLKGEAQKFSQELSFIKQNKKGLKLTITYPKRGFESDAEMPNKSGAYVLKVNHDSGISIEAYDELGAFYAIQTLRQVVESERAQDGTIPALVIRDWPDLKYRGVVEGFYGEPWSHEARLSLIDFYGRFKMNYYVYGPKEDPYHSSPYWREAYPEDEAREIKELVEACKRNRVHFVWAVHPGKDIKWEESDIQNLIRKFDAMYELGVRAFAVHFDDIEGAGTNPYYQTELMNILTEDFVKAKGDVEPLIVCPTEYTRLWANPTERGSLIIYGNELNPECDVFWTGDAVCSDMTERTMEWISSRIKRPALFWWNFPVTDYARHIIMQGPVYGLANTMDETKTRGILSNPMEHAEASKLALYSVGDYAWNVEAYNAIDSWERAIEFIAPEVKEAYRLFAIHSCDTETGYRRYESWETETFDFENYDAELAKALLEEFKRIEAVPAAMEAMKNRALLEELRPWLVEFAKLGTRCRKALEALELFRAGDYEAFWAAYVDNLMTEEQIEQYDAHRSGTMKLKPFYERLMDGMAAAYYEALTGEKSSVLAACGTYRSLGAPQAKYMFDNDLETYYHSGEGQRTDDFVGVDLGVVRKVRKVRIIQGRNSVDDVDYFDHCVLEYSVDGKEWVAMMEPMEGVYDILWQGEPFEARYVGIRKLESKKRNWLAIREFAINPVEKSEYGWDSNPFTSFASSESLNIAIAEGATSRRLLLGTLDSELCYEITDAKGKVLSNGTITNAEQVIALPEGATALHLAGKATLYEAIVK
ncbi:MAG: beta-N-acetylglucosaminidase domain-containing protein [Alistipes sp.]|nr:beta-N-acetylglucosaminidase domain-containing protein [Alistipes sp.]